MRAEASRQKGSVLYSSGHIRKSRRLRLRRIPRKVGEKLSRLSSNIAANLDNTPSGGRPSIEARRPAGYPIEISCWKEGGRDNTT